VDEAADAIVTGTGAFQDLLDWFAVSEADWRAGGIHGQLPCELLSVASSVDSLQGEYFLIHHFFSS
jgi:hypothetical protein